MSTAAVEQDVCSSTKKPHADAAILFGSVSSSAARKPASVRATCEAIGLPRSTFYYQSHRSSSAIDLEHKIVLRLHQLRACSPNDGYRRMTRQLQLEGFQVNRKRIARLMQLHSLSAAPSKASTTTPRCQQLRASLTNLLSTARLSGAHQAWLADITYVHIQSNLVYAAAIIDVWTRIITGYAVALQISNRLPSIALHSAVRAHRPMPGCIHHSISGTQYLMRGYRELVREYGLTLSAGDIANNSSATPASREVLEIESFGTWSDVIHNVDSFIQAVYSPERINHFLERGKAECRLL